MKRLARGAGKVIEKVARPLGRVSNLVKVLGGVIVVGGAGVLGGCESTAEQDMFLLGAALGIAAPYADTPQQSASMRSGGDAILADQRARRGRTQVTVNVNGGSAGVAEGRPSAKIHKIWLEHNVVVNDQRGMRIHTKFDVNNHKGQELELAAYFYDKNGTKLLDDDGLYRSPGGQVGVGSETLIPGFDRTSYNDQILFMPYEQLDVSVGESGKHHLKFSVNLLDVSRQEPASLDRRGNIEFWIKR